MKESVKTLRKWTDSWVIGKTEYMWNGGSDEDLDAIHASIRTVLAALESANERAGRAEAALERVRTAWNKSWDCSRDPGHTIMSDAFAEATDEN